jgi:hypothetical protein
MFHNWNISGNGLQKVRYRQKPNSYTIKPFPFVLSLAFILFTIYNFS